MIDFFKKIDKSLLFKNIFALLLVPIFVFAQTIIPDCGATGGRECNFYDLLALINNLINWAIFISIPITAGLIAWAGINYMISGIVDKKSEAKKMMWNTLKGFAFILSAWIIVSTVIKALLSDNYSGVVNDIIDLNK